MKSAKNKPKAGPRQENTKAKLLKAALDVFAKDGYDAATTRNIAKRAGVNESLIHRYFESKLGLFLALKNQSREKFLSEYLSYEESDKLVDEIRLFMTARRQRSERDKKFLKLVVSRAVTDTKVKADIQKLTAVRIPLLEQRFQRFHDKGLIRADVDLLQVVDIVQSLSFTLALLTDAIECIDSEEADKFVQTMSKIIADGLAPKK